MDDERGGWKALDTGLLRDHLHAATAVGRMAAAAKAVELGYGIEPDPGRSGRLGGWANLRAANVAASARGRRDRLSGRGGRSMPTVVAHHDISKGKDHWLSSPKREEVFGPLGVTNIRTFVNPQNPTHVAVLMDVENLDTVMAFMQTRAAAEAMAHDGVVPESLVLLVEE
jgi:hypothetical protein